MLLGIVAYFQHLHYTYIPETTHRESRHLPVPCLYILFDDLEFYDDLE